MRPSLPPRPKKRLPQAQFSAAVPDDITPAGDVGSAASSAAASGSGSGSASGNLPPQLPPGQLPRSLAQLSSEHVGAMQQVMASLATGQNEALLQQVSGKMGLSPDQLRQAAAAIAASEGPEAMPSEVVQRAMQLQWAMRNGAVPPMGPAAAAAVPAGMPPGLLGSSSSGDTHIGHAGHATSAPSMPDAPPASSAALLLDGEEQQGCFELYRRAYGRHLDLAYPPVYVAAASLAVWYGVLPFWLALLALPAGLILFMHLLLVRCAGIPAHLLPHSRLPMAMVASLEGLAASTFFLQMWPLLREVPWHRTLLALLIAGFFILHYRTYSSDPGYLEARGVPQLMAPAQRVMLAAQNPSWCYTCNVYKPIRTKHCSNCDRCVGEFDHHCPVVGNCVGVGNRRSFMGYLLMLWAAELTWIQLAAHFWQRVVAQQVLHSHTLPGLLQTVSHFGSLTRLWPGTLLTTLVVLFIFSGTTFLMGRQLLCVAGNLTINELIMRQKYGYLQSGNHKFFNPFDEGPAANCVQFWSKARPDWYSLYAKRQQLSGRQQQQQQQEDSEQQQQQQPEEDVEQQPSSGAGAGAGSWRTPRFSVSSLLRQWDEAAEALQASRMARRQHKEAMFLQQYGGVKPETAEQQQLLAANGGGGCAHGACRSCDAHP